MIKYIFIAFLLISILVILFFLKTFQYPSKIRKAEEYLEEGDLSRASDIIKKILEKKKDYVPARYLRALVLIKQNQYLMAISELNSIMGIPDYTHHVKEFDIHSHLANLYHETKNWQKEIEEYKLILQFNPDDIKANQRIGYTYYRQKSYKKAKDHLGKAVLLDPDLNESYLPLGIACFFINDYDKAEQYLLKAMTVDKESSEAQYYLGLIYKMRKDYENALTMFDLSKSNRTFYIESLYRMGEIHCETGGFDVAVDILEQGLKSLKKNDEQSHAYRYLLAECYEQENKIDEALHHWEKIALENPDYRSVRIKLDSYNEIVENKHMMILFKKSLEELQPLVSEIISNLQYNIISKDKVSSNEYLYRAYNMKRINDPPLLIAFNRTTREVTEDQIQEFYRKINEEKCKNGIYISTSKFSLRAKSSAANKMIELYGGDYVTRLIEKIQFRRIRKT